MSGAGGTAPLHAAMAVGAMNAGKHVYVEKPLAMNGVEAATMISPKQNNVHLMVGHCCVPPCFHCTRGLVDSGTLATRLYLLKPLSFGKVRSEEDVI